MIVVLFGVASFVSAALLFLVQPMVGKLVLPLFGGSPAVWNTAMLFFQALLLAGYAYAHLSVRWLGMRLQPPLHVAALLLPLLVLPIALPSGARPGPGSTPALWLLWVLVVVVGAPFLLVSTSGPLLQRWFAASDHALAADPYFLYAAGNAGSFLALLSYPFLVEPRLTLAQQTRLWSAGYLVLVALVLVCALAVGRRRAEVSPSAPPPAAGAPIDWRRQLRWVVLAFVPSSLMLGVTTLISTDIAAFPLLWVVPLALYLLTFVIAFGARRPRLSQVSARILPFAIAVAGVAMIPISSIPTALAVVVELAMFTAVAIVAHGKLADDRPEPSRLTYFYLLVAVGGALGGIFNGLLAPVMFAAVVEYPLVMLLAFVLLAPRRSGFGRDLEVAMVGGAVGLPLFLQLTGTVFGGTALVPRVVAIVFVLAAVVAVAARLPRPMLPGVALVLIGLAILSHPELVVRRTFFGVARVRASAEGEHILVHGTTIHGSQDRRLGNARIPQTYYFPSGPFGQVFAAYAQQPSERVGLIGLGAGALATYGKPGQSFTFYEIDPAIAEIASNPDLFSYIADSAAQVDIVLGDGRLSIEDAPDRAYGVIVVDGFSSDSIPVHLLTSEAVQLYRAKLAPGGVLAIHISNRHADLDRVVAAIASQQNLTAMICRDESQEGIAKVPTTVAVLAEDPETMAPLRKTACWRRLTADAPVLWTDDFSNVVSVLSWR